MLAFIDGDGVRLRSRRGLDLTRLSRSSCRPREAGRRSHGARWRDRRARRRGRPSFNALQNRAQLKTEREIAAATARTLCVLCFDLLHFAGVNLRKRAVRDRRRYLAQCLLPSPLVQLVHASEDGVALYAAALASGFEGVVGKRKDSRYEAGKRSPAWLKMKPTHTRTS